MALMPKILREMEGMKIVRQKIMISLFCLLMASFKFSSISVHIDLNIPLIFIHKFSDLNVKEV